MARILTKGRMLKAILVVSLALNLLVLAAVAGATWRHGGPPNKVRGSAMELAPAYLKALPRENRRVLRQALRGHGARKKMLELNDQMLIALREETFVAETFAEILTQQRSGREAMHTQLQELWLDHVKGLSLDERLQYANRIEEQMSRGRKRRAIER